jgi:hypothetical protein
MSHLILSFVFVDANCVTAKDLPETLRYTWIEITDTARDILCILMFLGWH